MYILIRETIINYQWFIADSKPCLLVVRIDKWYSNKKIPVSFTEKGNQNTWMEEELHSSQSLKGQTSKTGCTCAHVYITKTISEDRAKAV